jgi:hypothetical protein
LDIFGFVLGDYSVAYHFLFCKGIFKEGDKMKKIFLVFLLPLCIVNLTGCIFILGGAAGALGAYAISKDTIQGDSDITYEILWDSAVMVSRLRGNIISEDIQTGSIDLEEGSNRIWVRLLRLTQSTTRLKIAARKYHLPNLELAQDLYVRIVEHARKNQ